jgi:hypothetical protein
MSELMFNTPDYFKNVPEHIQKQYSRMVIKAIKQAIRNGLDIRIQKVRD